MPMVTSPVRSHAGDSSTTGASRAAGTSGVGVGVSGTGEGSAVEVGKEVAVKRGSAVVDGASICLLL